MKEKSKMERVNQYSTLILVLLIAISVGALGREGLIAANIIAPPQAVVEIKTDTMPLENGGEVVIQLIAGEKRISMSYKDLEYVSAKKGRMRELVKNIKALYLRMVE